MSQPLPSGCYGLEDALQRLKAVTPELRTKILASALRAGGVIIRDETSRRAPRRRGILAGSVQIRKAPKRLSGNLLSYLVSVTSRVAHLVELGTQRHEISPMSASDRLSRALSLSRRGGAEAARALMIRGRFVGGTVTHPGARPHPFMAPAFEARAADAIRATAARVAKGIERSERLRSKGSRGGRR